MSFKRLRCGTGFWFVGPRPNIMQGSKMNLSKPTAVTTTTTIKVQPNAQQCKCNVKLRIFPRWNLNTARSTNPPSLIYCILQVIGGLNNNIICLLLPSHCTVKWKIDQFGIYQHWPVSQFQSSSSSSPLTIPIENQLMSLQRRTIREFSSRKK